MGNKCSTGKVSYETEGLALVSGDEVNDHRKKEGNYEIVFSAYKCSECGEFHLTSIN